MIKDTKKGVYYVIYYIKIIVKFKLVRNSRRCSLSCTNCILTIYSLKYNSEL